MRRRDLPLPLLLPLVLALEEEPAEARFLPLRPGPGLRFSRFAGAETGARLSAQFAD
jgi:hypothetical protein